jgi:FkbM family methyltransferase
MINTLRAIKRAIHRVSAPGKPDKKSEAERQRLKMFPRYVETTTDIPGSKFRIPDAASFLASWEEIFDHEIYDFRTQSDTPRILDCGANVGVSCLYFKRRFPLARITAFEPDPKIFSYLKYNLDNAGISDVELCEKAVWNSETVLRFQSEGSDGGRVESSSGTNGIDVNTVRLRDYLSEKIDLLKIDIEGAEVDVLIDIANFLSNVNKIFVEYHSFEGQPQMLGTVIDILTEGGFRLQIHHMNESSKPFIKVRSNLGMDMQLNIFAYRVG